MAERPIPRSCTLICTPRSGSTLFYSVIESYLRQTEGIEGLEEFFNLEYHSVWEQDGGIRRAVHPMPAVLKSIPEISHKTVPDSWLDRIRRQRLELLRRYPNRYFYKIFPHQLSPEEFQEIQPWAPWIFVERRNLYEQFLSYAISILTGSWYVHGGIRILEASLEAPPQLFEIFVSLHTQYERLVALAAQGPTPPVRLVYEDFVAPDGTVDVRGILKQLSFHNPMESGLVHLPSRQNTGDKQRYFKDPQRLRDAYRASRLQERFPIMEAV